MNSVSSLSKAFCNHISSRAQMERAIYSASQVQSGTMRCFLLLHAIVDFPNRIRYPEMLFLVSAHPAKSESEYATKERDC